MPAGVGASKSTLLPPSPCSMKIVGKGPSPVGGSVTSMSSGSPSQVGTRSASEVVGQKRTPFWATQVCPNGAGRAAAERAASAPAIRMAASARMVGIVPSITWSETEGQARAEDVHHGLRVGVEVIRRGDRRARVYRAVPLERGIVHERVHVADRGLDILRDVPGQAGAQEIAVAVRDARVAELVAGGCLVILQPGAQPDRVGDLPLDTAGQSERVVKVLRIDERWCTVVRNDADLLEAAPAVPVDLSEQANAIGQLVESADHDRLRKV